MEMRMKEPYIEEVAIHDGPDHALVTREGAAKRWTGEVWAGLWSSEISDPGCRRRAYRRKAISLAAVSRAASGPRAV
jgi:hypothetical protein